MNNAANIDNPAEPPNVIPAQKRQKMSLFDTTHARNGGSPTSFATTSNTGIMDTTFGSTTEEEDDDETEQHYLNKMTDDTDRKVETVFGKGMDVWKSFHGTVYADVNDKIKKQRRDEEMWGKKKEKRKRRARGKSLERRFDSLRNSEEVLVSGSGSTSTSTPDLTPGTYTDSTIAYPSLLSNKGYHVSLPHTPTVSEWEIFPVRQSQYEDFPGTPLEYKSMNHASFNTGNTGTDMHSNVHRPIKPPPARAQRSQGSQAAPPPPHFSAGQPRADIDTPSLSTPALPVGSLGNMLNESRRIVSGSFGSFDDRQVDRFDEREYRLLPGNVHGAANEKQDGDVDQDGKPNKFKVRPWLRR